MKLAAGIAQVHGFEQADGIHALVLAPFRTAYAVSRDGQRFLLNALRPNPQNSSITIVLNGIPR